MEVSILSSLPPHPCKGAHGKPLPWGAWCERPLQNGQTLTKAYFAPSSEGALRFLFFHLPSLCGGRGVHSR